MISPSNSFPKSFMTNLPLPPSQEDSGSHFTKRSTLSMPLLVVSKVIVMVSVVILVLTTHLSDAPGPKTTPSITPWVQSQVKSAETRCFKVEAVMFKPLVSHCLLSTRKDASIWSTLGRTATKLPLYPLVLPSMLIKTLTLGRAGWVLVTSSLTIVSRSRSKRTLKSTFALAKIDEVPW